MNIKTQPKVVCLYLVDYFDYSKQFKPQISPLLNNRSEFIPDVSPYPLLRLGTTGTTISPPTPSPVEDISDSDGNLILNIDINGLKPGYHRIFIQAFELLVDLDTFQGGPAFSDQKVSMITSFIVQ